MSKSDATISKTCFFVDKINMYANQESESADRPALCLREVRDVVRGGRSVQDIVTAKKVNECVIRCACGQEVARFVSDYKPKERRRGHPLRLTPVNIWLEIDEGNATIEIVGEFQVGPWKTDAPCHTLDHAQEQEAAK